jgi:hypothetical protein
MARPINTGWAIDVAQRCKNDKNDYIATPHLTKESP